ncbi:MAG: Ribosomal RNA small subunit methyltransferase A [Parcubacteria group bacterium GW2011_GWB1_43_66]|nr:MAG: Ribosomal RNA small subunit methyltransferase A [Parcubacteria group bacterium GW2011_GWB1_43_66]
MVGHLDSGGGYDLALYDHMIAGSNLPADLRTWTKLSLAKYHLAAGQRLGQHFLVDKKVLQDILTAADVKNNANVLEVGGGLGVLTLELLARAQRVVVVELDKKLVVALQKVGMGSEKLKIIADDVSDWQIVANLPYEISGAFLERFLWGDFTPQSLTLLLQREVAERLAAKPGKMSLLSLSCQLKSQIKIIRHIPPQAFWPPPRVQSSLVRLDLFSPKDYSDIIDYQSPDLIWRLARIGFSARRKVLINNLLAVLPLAKEQLIEIFTQANIGIKARAQELSIRQWVLLARLLAGKI